jgi:23S rRNA (cytosine1962-C5)-methyltransferase
MHDEKFIMFANRLQKVYRHISRQAKRLGVSCYRVYDHDLPEFPFCIEVYEDKLYVAEYKRRHGMTDEEHEEWTQGSLNVISEIFQVAGENIFLKLRQRKPGRLGQYQKMREQQHEFVVYENARPDEPTGQKLRFIVNLSDYLDTGLFLDHRVTREMVKTEANNKKVLNLFCYTGSFSVYAAAGGAGEVVSVDLSKTYLNWAERNMELNGFIDKTKYMYVHEDVKQYLKTLPGNYFDLIIVDPPTFSNSQRMEEFLDIQRDHVEMINDCLLSMKTDGILYFSTNYRKFTLDKEKIKATSIKDITKATTPFDFEGRLFRQCYSISK